ncbi:MAG: ATP-dependent DNA ligase, partial [Acidobacteriota bacterium]
MESFARLYESLDGTTKTLAKVDAMASYFRAASPADAAWAVFFLSGRRFKRLVPPSFLRPLALEAAGLPEWLFADCYAAVGDLAETLTLLLDEPAAAPGGELSELPLHAWIETRIQPLRRLDEEEQRREILSWFAALPRHQLFILAKILTGGLRVGVSQTLTVRALAKASGVETSALHHRLMGHWQPSAEFFTALIDPAVSDADSSRPYPFYLASPLQPTSDQEVDPAELLGAREDWQIEWKWDGIRGQLVRRGGSTFLWSRGEELVTERYPEISAGAEGLPEGTVLDGEILAFRRASEAGTGAGDGEVLPFSVLQKRIGRKKAGKKILADAPVTFMAYDLLEDAGHDWRPRPLRERRARLEELARGLFPLSPVVEAPSWGELSTLREESRERQVEGFMVKRLDSPYRTGRKKGDW